MKRELYDKRNKLYQSSRRLKTLKFLNELKNDRELVTRLIEEQDKQYKQWLFYTKYINAIDKEKRR